MTIFTNTFRTSAVMLLALLAFSFTHPFETENPRPDDNGGNPWTVLQKRDGVTISYDIQDCLKDNLLLTMKIMNDTDKAKKLRFVVDIEHTDGSKETFNFIKAIAPYTTEKADCSEQSRQSGLVRMLKNASEESKVSLHYLNENGVAIID
ncbi:MAG: hypothetical protein IT258_15135 [Saprospiraceae bacterium]|nr:hypothetical protein [Saprospiraceae bacterium]